jgi:hypothetical protein
VLALVIAQNICYAKCKECSTQRSASLNKRYILFNSAGCIGPGIRGPDSANRVVLGGPQHCQKRARQPAATCQTWWVVCKECLKIPGRKKFQLAWWSFCMQNFFCNIRVDKWTFQKLKKTAGKNGYKQSDQV